MLLNVASPDIAEFTQLLEDRVRWEHSLLLAGRNQGDAPPGNGIAAPPTAETGPAKSPAPPPQFGNLVQRITGLPVLGPLASFLWRQRHHRHRFGRKVQGFEDRAVTTLLFVGYWSPGWGQLGLVRALAALAALSNRTVRLALAGPVVSPETVVEVRAEIARLGLADRISLFLNPGARQLRELYRRADLFVSLSEHPLAVSTHRYGVGLRAALAWDIPAVAFCPAQSKATSGPVLINTVDPDLFASACQVVLNEPLVRRHIRVRQRQQLVQLRSSVVGVLHGWNAELHPEPHQLTGSRTKSRWSLEGPFHSSYSLAVVNRELASALAQRDEDIGLISRDGPGPIAVPDQYLQDHPLIARLWRRGTEPGQADIALRNMYPPFVHDLKGELRGLSCYAWEETGFPKTYVHDFSASLDFVTVTSRFVAKVLRDNGVKAPIFVIGDGIDQVTRPPAIADHPKRELVPRLLKGRFCFLHISSCLPRKGIDVLLKAWEQAFDASDEVLLIIKATNNQHHDVQADVARLSEANPDLAPIVVITEDLADRDIHALYEVSDVLVAPSRGEGFGLPIAESLAVGKPVITTAFGGQMDFCSAESGWMCDYEFAYAHSHVSEPLSVWAEPKLDSLIECLTEAFRADLAQRRERGAAGRLTVRSEFSWDAVAQRLQAAATAAAQRDVGSLRLPTVAWVSTWNNRCGIADYSQSLTCAFPQGRLQVFANWNAEQQLGPDPSFVRRCWEQSWHDPLDDLFTEIVAKRSDVVVLQFNFGFYQIAAFARLVERLIATGRHVYLCLHSTADIVREDLVIRLGDALPALQQAQRVLVHSVHDLNRLKGLGVTHNVSILPFGMPKPPEVAPLARPRLRIATFGYLLPHKGALELIEAIRILRGQGWDLELLMLNATYPAPESELLKSQCEDAIARAGLADRVDMRTDFLAPQEIMRQLGSADLIAFPYQETQESASAAVRMGLGSLRPVATTPLAIFADIAAISHTLPGCSPEAMAQGIRVLLQDPSAMERFAAAQTEWVRTHQWLQVSKRLYDLICAELSNPLEL